MPKTHRSVAALICLPLLAACATVGAPGPVGRSLLDLALLSPPAVLRAQADDGRAEAQAALALTLRFGLNGQRIDPAASAMWRDRALAARGFTQVTSYTAAFRGQPSRVMLINVPRYDLPASEATAAERCALTLARDASNATAACGGPEATARLRRLWERARAPALNT